MIKVLIGDIFESKAQTLVNTVNTVGVMGKGIALGFRKLALQARTRRAARLTRPAAEASATASRPPAPAPSTA